MGRLRYDRRRKRVVLWVLVVGENAGRVDVKAVSWGVLYASSFAAVVLPVVTSVRCNLVSGSATGWKKVVPPVVQLPEPPLVMPCACTVASAPGERRTSCPNRRAPADSRPGEPRDDAAFWVSHGLVLGRHRAAVPSGRGSGAAHRSPTATAVDPATLTSSPAL